MYGVPGAVGKLDKQQLVHAVVIADMIRAPDAAYRAVAALTRAAQSQDGLTAAAVETMAGLPAWPSCLLRLLPTIAKATFGWGWDSPSSDLTAVAAADAGNRVQQLLLTVLGDLNAVLADKQLKEVLLELPLPAMQLLLSSDQLRVASEDTVLYTAQKYIYARSEEDMGMAQGPGHVRVFEWEKARTALSPLVRAPHCAELSLFALSCAALVPGEAWDDRCSSMAALDAYLPQLRSLLSLKQVASAELLADAVVSLTDIPSSWQLGPRQLRPLADGVRLQWRLPVQQLKAACRTSFTKQKTVNIDSPESSGPMGGLAWQLKVLCVQQDGGTVVGLYAQPWKLSADMWYKCKFTVTWEGVEASSRGTPTTVCRGFEDFFGLGPMAAGGWDEAAWAAKGLPTSGETLLQLHVHCVG
jgi:hypothetical protein